MLKSDTTGRFVLQYEVCGEIRRIPVPKKGISRSGHEWILGGLLLEVIEKGVSGSAQLFFNTFDELMIEQIERIGIGKKVCVTFHIESREYYNDYRTNVIIDDINALTDGENFVYGKRKETNQ